MLPRLAAKAVLVLGLALLAPAGPSAAVGLACDGCGPADHNAPSPELVARLSDWVAERLGVAAPEPPRVRLVPQEDIPRIAEQLSGVPVIGRNLVAIYIPGRREIVLRGSWKAYSQRDLSALVHELTHHVDFSSDRKPACGADRERLAYEVQADWLAQYGDTLEAAYSIDKLTLLLLTACGA